MFSTVRNVCAKGYEKLKAGKEYVGDKLSSAVNWVGEKANSIAAGAIVALGGASAAQNASAADAIPDAGITWATYATEGATKIGIVLSVCVGVVLMVALATMGIKKLSHAFQGRA